MYQAYTEKPGTVLYLLNEMRLTPSTLNVCVGCICKSLYIESSYPKEFYIFFKNPDLVQLSAWVNNKILSENNNKQ